MGSMNEFDDQVLQWIIGNEFKTSAGLPFEWKEHCFLIDPLTDFHPIQGTDKCTQIGWSEMMLLKTFYIATELKCNTIYTLPSSSFVETFVPQKADPIIQSNDYLNSRITGGVRLKEVELDDGSKRFINFIGAHNPKSESKKEEGSKGISLTSDVNIHDEASRSDQFVLEQLESRYSNSLYKWNWKFDNPTYPKMGADYIYKKSDQRHWFVRCHHCNYPQYLAWERLDQVEWQSGTNHCFIDPIRKVFICGKCKGILDDQDRLSGFWLAKYPSITEYRGYWLSQLDYIRHSVEELVRIDDSEKTSRSYFNNYVLGKPYVGSDIKVSREHIAANISNNINLLNENAMGVDQGTVKWYVIGNKQGIFKVGYTESWDEIELLRNRYSAKLVMDGLPDQYDTKKLASKYQGEAWRAFYKPESDQSELARFSPKNDRQLVLIRREEMFDELVGKIVNGQFPINININDLQKFIDHWESLVKIITRDSEGNDRFSWTRIDADHFAHATLYFYTALKKTGTTQAKILSNTTKVANIEAVEVKDNKIDQTIFNELIGRK